MASLRHSLFAPHLLIRTIRDAIALTGARVRFASMTETNKFQRQRQKTESLVHLESIRHWLVIDSAMYKTEEAAEMLLYLHDQQYVFPESLSDDVLLCDVGASVHLFEDPANTGFAFFLRYHANTWTLWNVLLIFESALFLCAWIKKAAVESKPVRSSSRISGGLYRWRGPLWMFRMASRILRTRRYSQSLSCYTGAACW